jgi:hypothetical protein
VAPPHDRALNGLQRFKQKDLSGDLRRRKQTPRLSDVPCKDRKKG